MLYHLEENILTIRNLLTGLSWENLILRANFLLITLPAILTESRQQYPFRL